MATIARAGAVESQEPGASSRFPTRVQGHKALDRSSELSQTIHKELDQEVEQLEHEPYEMLAPAGGGLPVKPPHWPHSIICKSNL